MTAPRTPASDQDHHSSEYNSDEIMTTATPTTTTASVAPTSPAPPNAPPIGEHTLLSRDNVEFRIRGTLIGFASSERDDHGHSTAGTWPYVQPGQRCSGCRWFEIRIFCVENEITHLCNCAQESDGMTGVHTEDCGFEPPRARYLVLTYGRTVVTGETDKRRASWTDSPHEVLELLTQRNSGSAFLPATSARALAQAAHYDSGIYDAYINRAVV